MNTEIEMKNLISSRSIFRLLTKSAVAVPLALNLLGIALPAQAAKLSVVATTTDLKALVREVAGDLADVESVAKGTQDPHFIEAKPSYMTKVHQADLVVAMGLELEVGWLPSILRGARNPKVMSGPGLLELGPYANPLEVTGQTDRSEGDVHPAGNPHFNLDPVRMGNLSLKVAERLGQLDPEHATLFKQRAEAFQKRMTEKTALWQARIKKSGVTQVITYHKTMTYFLERFGLANPAVLEPKPGIPPTSGHIIEVINLIKQKHVPLILVENYFDPTVTNKIKEDVPAIRVVTVAVGVEGAPGIATLDDLYEALVRAVEGK